MKKWAFGSKIKHALQKSMLLALASLIVGSTLLPLTAQPVAAAPSNIDERVRAYLYYYAFSKCVDGRTVLFNQDVAENSWRGNEEHRLGYYIDTEDGRRGCGNMITDALKVWGYKDLASALKDWNYKQDEDGNWVNDNPGSGYGPGVRRTAFGGKEPSLSGADFYRFYYQTMSNACELSGKKEYATANAAEKTAADRGRGYLRIKEVSGNPPKIVDIIYKYGRTSQVNMAESAKGIPNTMTCADIAKRVSDNAGAFLRWTRDNPSDIITSPAGGTDNPNEEEKSSCNIDGVGWILCPVINLFAAMTDQAYKVISQMLEVRAFTNTSGDKQLYAAWENMRNIANIAFVIAFLIIIYSQITGVGITNYGIKKMLPRIILAAILVNVSYVICSLAVDISNIVGNSMNSVIQSAGGQGVGAAGNKASDFATSAGGWVGVAGTVIAGSLAAGALYLALPVLLTGLVAAAFAVTTVFLVLTLRQALIILLIVIAPLAFVALLLPNTEDWFKKWRGLFVTLLLMYPIIGLIFGASALASDIVMQSAGGGTGAGDEGMKVAIQIMAGLISILPLAITPVVMKTAGGVLNRFAGFVNNPNKGPFDAMRRRAEQKGKDISNVRATRALSGKFQPFGGRYRREAKRNAITSSREAGRKDASTGYVAREALGKNEQGEVGKGDGDTLFAKQMAGGNRVMSADEGARTAVVASALAQQKKAFAEDVSSMEALIKVRFKDDPGKALADALHRGDEVQAVAAQNLLIRSGGSGVSSFRDQVESAEQSGDLRSDSELAAKLRENIKDNHGQYVKAKGADIVTWAAGQKDESGNIQTLGESSAGKLSDNDLASQHAGSVEKAVRQNNVSAEQATRMLSDPRVSANLDPKQKAALVSAGGKVNQQPPEASTNSPGSEAGYEQRDSGLYVPKDNK